MLAKYEHRTYQGEEKVWTGIYKNLINWPHRHEDCEIIFIIDGTAEVFIDGKTYNLHQGDSAFVSSKQCHYIKSQDSKIAIVIYSEQISKKITDKYLLSNPIFTDLNTFDFFNEITLEKKNKNLFYENQIYNFTSNFVIKLFRTHIFLEKNEIQRNIENRFFDLLEYIDLNYSTITFKEAALYLGFSEPYFSKYFKEISGFSFSKYLNLIKIEKAVEMLKYNKEFSITTVSTICGFDTIRSFNRNFKEILGITPREVTSQYEFKVINSVNNKELFDPTSTTSELLIS